MAASAAMPAAHRAMGAGAAEGALLGRGGLHQGAQIAAGLIEQARIARGQPGLQRQGGAVQPQIILQRALASEAVQGGVHQA